MEAGRVGKDIGDGGWGGGEDGDLVQGIAMEKAVVTDELDASRQGDGAERVAVVEDATLQDAERRGQGDGFET